MSRDQAAHTPTRPLMSMPEIAEFAGVRRPVVTTWRRRHPGFPAPAAGDAAQPLFDARLVADWLVGTGRGTGEKLGPELSMYTLGSLSRDVPVRDLVALVTSLICLRHLDADEPLAAGDGGVLAQLACRARRLDPHDNCILTEIGSMPRGVEGLPAAVDDLVEAAWGSAGAFERVMRERHRFRAAELFVDAVTPPLAKLMAEVCGIRELARNNQSPVIDDPSAGTGDLLVAVAEILGPDYSPRFSGAEEDAYLARLARRRLLVHGVPASDLDIRADRDPRGDSVTPDVIVTRIAYVPGEERSPAEVLAVLDEISLRLAKDRIAVVLGPANILVSALPAYSAAERDRTRLIASGMVEAVIRLPGGQLPFRPGYQPALWVMSSSFSSPWAGRVLLADVSGQPLTDKVVDGLVDDVVTWRRHGYNPQAHTRQFSSQELISDLVDTPRPLTPGRPLGVASVTVTAAARVSRVVEVEAALGRLTEAQVSLSPLASHLATGTTWLPGRMPIGTLVRQALLIVIKGTRISDGHVSEAGHHAVVGPEEVLGSRQPGAAAIDRGTLADRYPQARLTEPGDVIVTSSPAVGAIVDTAGFSVVSFPARALRITEAGRAHFTPRVLAELISTSAASQRPTGAVRPAYRLDELPLPMLSGDDLRRLDDLLALLAQHANRARQELDLLSELRKLATAGVSDGTLTFTDDPNRLNDGNIHAG